MNANVWDLGYSTNLIHSTLYTSWSINRIITQLASQGIIFFLTPLGLTKSIPVLLIFQSVILGLPVFLIFEIANQNTGDSVIAILCSAAYAIYFPLAGPNWSDFHFMNLFPFLFLLGYLLFIKGHQRLAFLFFLLSGFVRFPFMVLVVATAFSLSINAILSNLKSMRSRLDQGATFFILLLFASLAILVLQYCWLYFVNPALIVTHASTSNNPLLNLTNKIYTIGILLGPLLFLPLFSRRWILPIMVFCVLVFFFNNPIYEYPQIFSNWYTISVIPFLFLGLVDVLSHVKRKLEKRIGDQRRSVDSLEILKNRNRRSREVILTVVIILVAMAPFLQPYGPLNDMSFNDFHFDPYASVNTTLYEAATTIVNMIPQSEKYVLLQNDIPQFFPRTDEQAIIVAPYNVGPNITEQDIAQNRFPYNGVSVTGYLPIDYAVIDMNSIHSLTEPSPFAGYPTMIELAQILFNSSYYGILAEDHGIILMKRNYTENVDFLAPFSESVNLNGMYLDNASYARNGVTIQGPISNATERTPFLFLGPGTFQFNVTLDVSNTTNTLIYLEAGYYASTSHFIFLNRTVEKASSQTGTEELVLNIGIQLDRFVGNAQCFLIPINLQGTLEIRSIEVTQK